MRVCVCESERERERPRETIIVSESGVIVAGQLSRPFGNRKSEKGRFQDR